MNGLYNHDYSYMKDYILPQSNSELHQDLQSVYMNPEQTFHTPSFGDEEFDLLPLGLGQQGMDPTANTGMAYLQHQQQMTQVDQMMAPQQQQNIAHYVQNPAPVYHQQTMYMPPMNSNEMAVSQNYVNNVGNNNVHHQQQQYGMNMNMGMGPGHQHHNPAANVMMSAPTSTVAPQSQFLTTISQAQLSSQLGLHFGIGQQPTNTSPRSNQTSSPGQETSEDSDDNVHQISHMIGGIGTKRPSPEPVIVSSKSAPKKPKAAKKKKKRDPNEPQKPVSAYALFFRDTQAAIKGQNPNASFGEVSKIVASMWDTLDEDHKNVYKKRTEAAKKDYLKALAAYRASLVSKGATDHAEIVYGTSTTNSGSPPSLSPPVSLAVSSSSSTTFVIGPGSHYPSTSVSSSTGLVNVSTAGNHSPPQELSPLQKKSPLLTSLMEGSNSNSGSSPPAHNSMSPPLANSHIHQMSPPSQQLQQQLHLQQQQPMRMISPQLLVQHQQQQQQQQTTAPYSSIGVPNPSHGNINMAQNVEGGEPQQLVNYDRLGSGNCLRNGCPNPAVESSEWDNEYCSNDCVVSHCRDVFTAWVASRQATNSYASVK